MSTADLPVISYARLSRKADRAKDGKGGSLAIDRQHEENAAYIAQHLPGVRVVYLEDDGFSGYKDVERPAFERAMSLIESRQARAFVGWHADRMTRQVEVTGRIVRACETARVELHTTLGGYHADPTRIYMESVMAEGESRQKSKRLVSKHRQLAASGGFSGGARRFGFEPRMAAIRPDEAAVIQDMAARALAGESLKSIARSLNDKGVPTAKGGALWRPTTIRQILVSPHLAGLRVHTDSTVEPPVTTTVPASWGADAILDESTHLALVRHFTNPTRKAHDAPRSNRYLLSGLITCGVCGAPMRAAMVAAIKRSVYRCQGEAGKPFCKGVVRRMEDVDALVSEYVVARLENLDGRGAGLMESDADVREGHALATERADLAARRKDLAGLLASGALDAPGFAAAVAAITERETAVDAAIAHLADRAASPARALDGATGDLARPTWAAWQADTSGAGLARMRALVSLLVDVRIDPMPGSGLTVEGVSVDYRELSA